ncbi:EnvZ/OmpR regulon moderator MzrA [Erwinia sp. E602]|uniref:EnvZ/OmpR regulon moderator MzrA n=1 Tax=Erwinia sp. E602 TaxID=2675378 RepID=UPI001BA5C4FF|nr:EnvZ/OmpR regulon moderator MzrA [Erwinia sp. E602]QUG77287.1 EnvZ/OmpR regulon moderator MzrA [Erwinia sp. E602]
MRWPFFRVSGRSLRLAPWLLLAGMALLGLTLMPALFRTDSSLQIRSSRPGSSPPDGFYVYQSLSAQGIRIKSITPEQNALVIKFDSQEQSLAAEKVLRELLPFGFAIDHPEATTTARWLGRLNLRT